MSTKAYVILHRKTGLFMPRTKHTSKATANIDEARTFSTISAAKTALRTWTFINDNLRGMRLRGQDFEREAIKDWKDPGQAEIAEVRVSIKVVP